MSGRPAGIANIPEIPHSSHLRNSRQHGRREAARESVAAYLAGRLESSVDHTRPQATGLAVSNRLRPILVHVPWYMFEPQRRFADDLGVTPAAVSRLVNGKMTPSYRLAETVAAAVSRRLGWRIEPREIFSLDGTYPTASTCALTDCPGCLPEHAYDRRCNRRPEWKDARPGDWCRYPKSLLDDLWSSA